MNLDSVKVALVGIRGYGDAIAQALIKCDKLELLSCYDILEDIKNEFAEKHRCYPARDLQEIVNDPEIEGVIIITPNHFHRDQVLLTASKGKHIFVEKPISNTIPEAKEMIEACRENKVLLAIGHNTRRFGGHRKMKELLDQGVLGKVIMAEANFSHNGGLRLTPDQWRYYDKWCPSGPLLQLGVHQADTLRYLLGDIEEVTSFFAHLATPAENNDVTLVLLRFASGPLGYLGSNYVTPSLFYVNLYGTRANLYCEDGNKLYIKEVGSDRRRRIPTEEIDTRSEELTDFAESIRSFAKPEVSGEEALLALAVVRAAIKSNECRIPISISEVLNDES